MEMFIIATWINIVPLPLPPCAGGFLCEQQDRESCSKMSGRTPGRSGWDCSSHLFPASMEENPRFLFPSLTLSFLNVDAFLMSLLGQEVSKNQKMLQIPCLKCG